jgi:glyceraldehyde 3-phosphate dehydrogenase
MAGQVVRVGINGFGRIGRLIYRAMAEQKFLDGKLEVVAVNDLVPADNLAYLLKYDSTQLRFNGDVSSQASDAAKARAAEKKVELEDDLLFVDGKKIECLAVKEGPERLQTEWRRLGVEYVIESTGLFTDAAKARQHLHPDGAKKVIISAPAKDEDITIVMGVNDGEYKPAEHNIVSNASCTTNCLAPIVHVLLKEGFGIDEAIMTTVHSYTATQKTVDGPSKKDWKGGRAAAINIIPSTTGATKAIVKAFPQLKGRLTGMSFRVPTPTVSVVDLSVRITADNKTYNDISVAMERASKSYLAGVLGHTRDQVVSTDFIHDTRSSIFDHDAGMSIHGSGDEANSKVAKFFKLISWYDNEWGYSNRCVDLLKHMIGKDSR